MANCEKSDNRDWLNKHGLAVDAVLKTGPSGSGIDGELKIDYYASKADRLVLKTAFHHMDCAGGYDGWTYHELIVTPSLQFGINIRITGRDRKDIKEYLAEVFDTWLNADVVIAGTDPYQPNALLIDE
jgi:hypothetical protein